MANKSGTTIALALTSVLLLGTAFYFVARAGRRKGELQGIDETPETPKKRKSSVSVGELESLGYGDKVNQPTKSVGNMNIFETLMSKLSFKPTTSTYGVDPDRLKAINEKAIAMGMGSATRKQFKLNTELGIKGL